MNVQRTFTRSRPRRLALLVGSVSAAAAIQVVGRFMYVAAGPLLIYEISEEPAFRSVWTNGEIIELFWNAPAGFRLQSTSSLISADWKDVPDVGDQTRVSLPVSDGNKFFRLYKP